ncbi:hypothetical protein [Deinococcus sp. UYEF24]
MPHFLRLFQKRLYHGHSQDHLLMQPVAPITGVEVLYQPLGQLMVLDGGRTAGPGALEHCSTWVWA